MPLKVCENQKERKNKRKIMNTLTYSYEQYESSEQLVGTEKRKRKKTKRDHSAL